VILEDDETNPLSIQAAAMPAPVDPDIESTVDLNRRTDLPSQEAWYDVEDGHYVLEGHLLPPQERDSLTPTLVQDQNLSPGSSQDLVDLHNDGNTQRTSDGPAADTLSLLFGEDCVQECEENMSELKMDILLAFKEQEGLSPVTAPSSPAPLHHSPEPNTQTNGRGTGLERN
jgi:hypothetical protein